MHARLLFAFAVALFLAGCSSTPDQRIAENQAAFAQFPPDVQQNLRAGRIDIGYTEAMVLIALGEPAHRLERVDGAGRSDVWVYRRNAPRFSFGFGVGSFGRHSATSVGVSTSTGGPYDDEALRVEFQQGRVTRIDFRKR
ncbi:MAG: hypothetical protein KF715_04850 [Candidatus Didemnitutus sp.]|nr:hypothetical protein [Candidatus Didemnitutus sp.]